MQKSTGDHKLLLNTIIQSLYDVGTSSSLNPYLLWQGLAVLLTFLLPSVLFAPGSVERSRITAIHAVHLFVYFGRMYWKSVALGRWVGRHGLRDYMTVQFPLFCGLSLLLGVMDAAFTYLAVFVPCWVGVGSMGCFFVGCCYGPPSNIGVVYCASKVARFDNTCKCLWKSPFTAWMTNKCYPHSKERVSPLNLVTAIFAVTLATTMLTGIKTGLIPSGLMSYVSMFGVVAFYSWWRSNQKAYAMNEGASTTKDNRKGPGITKTQMSMLQHVGSSCVVALASYCTSSFVLSF